jgi:methylated-DNA-[protein]-cysteine S-methyltransferase
MTKLDFGTIPSPLGNILLATDPATRAVCALDFDDCQERMERLLDLRFGHACELVPTLDPGGHTDAIRSYFSGHLDALAELPVDTGGTEFQQAVWRELRRIPAGHTRSYAEVANAIGRPAATRAVGAANGRNPVALIIPCHRVVGADGALTGYAGGLSRKRWLLNYERARV